MEKFLADTHALAWYAEDSPKLGHKARRLLDLCQEGRAVAFVSVISLLEIDYLIERKKVDAKLPEILLSQVLQSPDSALRLLDIDLKVYRAFLDIPSKKIPELPDRILAATSLAYSLPLVTKDSKISESGCVTVIWD